MLEKRRQRERLGMQSMGCIDDLEGIDMLEDYGRPFTGKKLERLKDFLEEGGLEYDREIEFTVNLLEDSRRIVATGSLRENILQCILVDKHYQGEGLTGTVMTHLRNEAVSRGRDHLFLFTKPENQVMFSDFGFFPVASTADVLLLENRKDGIRDFVGSLERPGTGGVTGAVVCNCNPFTLGHLYLIQSAAEACDTVHVFVLSEDKSAFPAGDRIEMVRRGTAHLPGVLVHPTADYLISSATFPTYFLKEKADPAAVNCRLDFTIFRDCFAVPLGITKRFVGSEPFCPVTGEYNRQMMDFFRDSPVEIVVLPRRDVKGTQVSASLVRELLAKGRTEEAAVYLPGSTREYLESESGQAVIQRLEEGAAV